MRRFLPVVLAALVVLLAGCAGLEEKKDETAAKPVKGVPLSNVIGGYGIVIPEGWVPLESSPTSFLDPDPFAQFADRQIFVRKGTVAVFSIDLMLTVSDGATLLDEEEGDLTLVKVGDFLARILSSRRGKGDPTPEISFNEPYLLYDATKRTPHGATRYLGAVRKRPDGGFIVIALAGSPDDTTLAAALESLKETLIFPTKKAGIAPPRPWSDSPSTSPASPQALAS